MVELRESELTAESDEMPSLGQADEQFQREFIKKALVKYRWDMVKTASELKIDDELLHKKIKDLGISFFG